MDDGQSDLLTRAQAAEALGVSVRSIDNYVRDGHLNSVRKIVVGRRVGVFVEREEIERFKREAQTLVGTRGRGR
jgi:predicted site-specific integrase-resolvase